MKIYLLSFLLSFFLVFQAHNLSFGAGDFSTDTLEAGMPNRSFSSNEFISQWTVNHSLFKKLVGKLEKDHKKFKDHPRFLKSLYYRTEMYLLEQYQQYALLDDVMQDGKFDCVSASLLLAALLEEFEIPYKIVETSYHVFLIVEHMGDRIVLESTAGIDGYIASPTEVRRYLDSFAAEERQTLNLNSPVLGYESVLHPSIYREISISELKGLEHFNRAIFHNNEGNMAEAIGQIERAKQYYPCDRVNALESLIKQQRILAENE